MRLSGHLSKFAPSSSETIIALPYPAPDACPPCTTGPYPTGAGVSNVGGSAGGKNAFPVAAGLVNNSTSPIIASIATTPKSKMFTSFLSVMLTSCACALILLVFFAVICTRSVRSCLLCNSTL